MHSFIYILYCVFESQIKIFSPKNYWPKVFVLRDISTKLGIKPKIIMLIKKLTRETFFRIHLCMEKDQLEIWQKPVVRRKLFNEKE